MILAQRHESLAHSAPLRPPAACISRYVIVLTSARALNAVNDVMAFLTSRLFFLDTPAEHSAESRSFNLSPMFLGSSVVERRTVNPLVGGSNPSRGANLSRPYSARIPEWILQVPREIRAQAGRSSHIRIGHCLRCVPGCLRHKYAVVRGLNFMKQLFTVLATSALLMYCSGAQCRSWNGIDIDPHSLIRPELLTQALDAYEQHQAADLSRTSMAIVDFSRPSSQRRLYVIDLQTGAVSALLVAHGRGSDLDHDAIAERFSDESQSHASSLGAYRATTQYQGAHGLSLTLDGLDLTNRSARARAVVLHSQWYVSDRMVAQRGKLGRSYGCFVVDVQVVGDLVHRLEGGGFLYAGH